MKFLRLLPLLLILCALGTSAQKTKSVEPAQERNERVKDGIAIKVGKETKISGEDLKIAFVSVMDDSRCPEGATCVWAGNGRAHFTASNSKGDCVEFDLNTMLTPGEYDFGKYKIKLANLSPHPSIKHQPKPDEYVATLVVTKNTKE
jgi:hypothetical protein